MNSLRPAEKTSMCSNQAAVCEVLVYIYYEHIEEEVQNILANSAGREDGKMMLNVGEAAWKTSVQVQRSACHPAGYTLHADSASIEGLLQRRRRHVYFDAEIGFY
jgi:hypothetical protein